MAKTKHNKITQGTSTKKTKISSGLMKAANTSVKQKNLSTNTVASFICNKCSFKCKKLDTLECHKISHIKEPFPILTRYSCTLCNQKFRKISRLELHRLKIHKIKPIVDFEEDLISHRIPIKTRKDMVNQHIPDKITNTPGDCEVIFKSHVIPNNTQNDDYDKCGPHDTISYGEVILQTQKTEDYTNSNSGDFNTYYKSHNHVSDDNLKQHISDVDFDTFNKSYIDESNDNYKKHTSDDDNTFNESYINGSDNKYKQHISDDDFNTFDKSHNDISDDDFDTQDNNEETYILPHHTTEESGNYEKLTIQHQNSDKKSSEILAQTKEQSFPLLNISLTGTKVQHNTNKKFTVKKNGSGKNTTLMKMKNLRKAETGGPANNTSVNNLENIVTQKNLVQGDENLEVKNKSIQYKPLEKATKTRQKLGREAKYMCDFCAYKTTRMTLFRGHMMKHSGQQPYACEQCDYKTCWSGALNRHKRTHNEDAEKPYDCDKCYYRSNQLSNLKRHLHIHTKNMSGSLIRKFTKKQSCLSQAQARDSIYNCGNCEFETNTESIMEMHVKSQCLFKSFSNITQLYICDTCGHKSSTRRRLIRHFSKHSTVMPYTCNECKFKCKRSETLERHMQIHAKPAILFTSYTCPICDKKFRSYGRFEMHKIIHERRQSTQNSKIHNEKFNITKFESCNVCSYICKTKYDLSVHMRSHTGEKPFRCELCSYRCTTSSHLIIHMRKHTGERPYVCNTCNAAFTQTGSLRKHMKIHTRSET